MDKNCDNCSNSGRPSYEYPCTVCTSAYGSAPTKWEGMVPANADMVEVVRCKDCKNRDEYGACVHPTISGYGWEHLSPKDEDFCSYGERRTDVD